MTTEQAIERPQRDPALQGLAPGRIVHVTGEAEMTIRSDHLTDAGGNPAGGATYGIGFGIAWQNGPINEPGGGRNGAFVEEVIEAALDRLIWYQTTRFQCQENAEAAEHLNAALSALHRRTSRRVAAGTEGTHRGN